jgi:GNAT superfamily N-acetyltransferase
MDGFTIRAATVEDVPRILQFIRGLAEYERLSGEVVATEAILRESLFGATPRAEVFLGSLDARPVAFAVVFHNFSTFEGRAGLYLEDLFVLPEHRGRGFGKAMLQHLARVARERKCPRLEWAVLDWNESAIRFYQGLGATALDDWTVFRVTGDALDRLARSAACRVPSAASRERGPGAESEA